MPRGGLQAAVEVAEARNATVSSDVLHDRSAGGAAPGPDLTSLSFILLDRGDLVSHLEWLQYNKPSFVC